LRETWSLLPLVAPLLAITCSNPFSIQHNNTGDNFYEKKIIISSIDNNKLQDKSIIITINNNVTIAHHGRWLLLTIITTVVQGVYLGIKVYTSLPLQFGSLWNQHQYFYRTAVKHRYKVNFKLWLIFFS